MGVVRVQHGEHARLDRPGGLERSPPADRIVQRVGERERDVDLALLNELQVVDRGGGHFGSGLHPQRLSDHFREPAAVRIVDAAGVPGGDRQPDHAAVRARELAGIRADREHPEAGQHEGGPGGHVPDGHDSVQCILTGMRKTLLCTIALTLYLASLPSSPSARQAPADWPQWGGPHRNFVSSSTGLASTWPSGGPRRLWSRALGEGHSAITVEGGRLYTMYRPLGLLAAVRRSQEEVVTAVDAATGKTIWEHKFASPTEGVNFSEGAGPHSTPLVTADRVFAVGSRKEVFALNKANGQVAWSHDMIKEYGASGPDRGYAPSPLLHGDVLIVPMGGPGQAIAAFNHRTGALAWKTGNFQFSPASPSI